MQAIKSVFDYVSGLGNYVVIPIMITIVGLIVRLKFSKALKAGITVGIGLIGLDMILNLLWTYISPVANIFVEKFHLNLTTVDIGWSAAAGLAFSTAVGSFIIPFIIMVNVVLLSLKLTRTINIDIWNYWHYAFSGAVIYTLTGNLFMAFTASACHCIIALKIADSTAKTVQEALGVPGISIPQGYAVTTVPIYKALDKLYDIVLPKKQQGRNGQKITEKFGFLKTISEPLFLGLIIGIILGVAAGYGVKETLTVGMAMAALMHLLPRMIKVIMEGLLPISEQTRAFMQNKFQGEEFYIGMDSAIMLGLPTTMSVALLLIPITLVLAMILPINQTLPLGDLASTAYFISMATPIHKNSFGRTLISGTIMMAIVLCVSSFFAPMITQFAATGALTIPEGAIQVTALSAGNLIAFIFYQLSKLRLLGTAIIVVLTGAVVFGFQKFTKKES